AGALRRGAERSPAEHAPGLMVWVLEVHPLGATRVRVGVFLRTCRVSGLEDSGIGTDRTVRAPLPDVPHGGEDPEVVAKEPPRVPGAIPRVQPGPGVAGQEGLGLAEGPGGLGTGPAVVFPLGLRRQAVATPIDGILGDSQGPLALLVIAPLAPLDAGLLA